MQSNPNDGEFRFAVIKRNMLSSNSWKVLVDRKGSAYICCRDNMKEIKASFHESGKQHVAFTSESGLLTTDGDRFLQKMEEPDTYTGPTLTPCYNLFFPSWGLSLTPEMRHADSRLWSNGITFIDAAEDPLATTLSFCIVDSALNLKPEASDESAFFPVASLALRPGKKLLVVRRYEADNDLRQLALTMVEEINGDAETLAAILDPRHNETPIMLRSDGKNSKGIPFTMPFAVSAKDDCQTGSTQLVTPFAAAPAPGGGPGRDGQVLPGVSQLNEQVTRSKMSLEPITHISLNLGPNMGTTNFMVGIRVVQAGRDGNKVYGRTLNTGELDNEESIQLDVGDNLIFPEGNLRITLRDVDKYAEVQSTGYAAITNTVWTWLQMPPPKSEAFFHYLLATARRLDQATCAMRSGP